MAKEDRTLYGGWLIEQRRRRGLTQSDLAHAAGLSPRTIYLVEAGQIPQPKTIRKIYEALEKSTEIVPENVDFAGTAGDLDAALSDPGAAIASPATPVLSQASAPPG